MTPPVISTCGLTKRYGSTLALDGLDLELSPGTVFGYLGPNGAGKTTTIRLLMGLIRPTAGTASVLGHDVVRDREAVHRLAGYLPGDFRGYGDLTGRDYLQFLARLRGGVAGSAIADLAERFDLDLDRRIGSLSHGNRQKIGIIQACMHDPPLLVLDEPTSGLDPLMQHEFVELLRQRRDAGRTVFLSSHVLAEVEAVADIVGIIRRGRLVLTSGVADLKARTRRRVELTFGHDAAPPIEQLARVPNVTEAKPVDGHVEVTVEGSMADLMRTAAPYGIERVVSDEVDLENLFLRYYEDEVH